MHVCMYVCSNYQLATNFVLYFSLQLNTLCNSGNCYTILAEIYGTCNYSGLAEGEL